MFEHPKNFREEFDSQNRPSHYWTGQWISIFIGALPRTPLGELTALPRPLAGGEGACNPLPKKPFHLGLLGLGLQPSLCRPQ